MLKKIVEISRSLLILFLMTFLGNGLESFLNTGIPGSIWGLLFLFVGLVLQVIKVQWVQPTSSLLIRYMLVLFLPMSAGLVDQGAVLKQYGISIFVPVVISTLLTLIFVGVLADYLFSRRTYARLKRKMLKKRLQQRQH